MNLNIRDTKEQLVHDVRAVISESEQLLRSVTSDGSERALRLKADLEDRLQNVRAQLRNIEAATVERAKAVAHTTDAYVHDKPWQAIAVAAGIGAIVGLMAAMSYSRHDD